MSACTYVTSLARLAVITVPEVDVLSSQAPDDQSCSITFSDFMGTHLVDKSPLNVQKGVLFVDPPQSQTLVMDALGMGLGVVLRCLKAP